MFYLEIFGEPANFGGAVIVIPAILLGYTRNKGVGMGKIDGQMMSSFRQMTKNSSDQGKQVSQEEAMVLIRRAQVLNGTYTSSCTGASENKGNKNLKKLVSQHEDKFSPESMATINNFLHKGRSPNFQGAAMVDPYMVPFESEVPRGGPSSMPSRPVAPTVIPGPMPSHTHVHRDVSGLVSSRSEAASEILASMSMNGGSMAPAAVPPRGGASIPASMPTSSRTGAPRDIPASMPSRATAPHPAPVTGGPALNPNAAPIAGGAMPATDRSNVAPRTPRAGGNEPSFSARSNVGPGAPATTDAARPRAGAAPVDTRPAPGSTPNIATPATNANTRPANVGGPTGVATPHGTRILDFKASKATWNCHWFPMQEKRPGGDEINNLFAKKGALHKLDMVTGKSSQQYEFTHHRKTLGDGLSYSWWGHCNDASQSACAFMEPKRNVTMKARDGSDVTFTTNDIQGLLVKASSSLVNKVDFKGQRFNSAGRDDPSEPRPAMFMEVMKDWAKGGLPFVLDIDREGQVWNFPYDQVQIDESSKAPPGYNAAGMPSDGGSVKYYHIHMAGTGYPDKVRNYECYVKYDANGTAVDSNWIKTPNSNNNPDFMWRPHPMDNLHDRSVWQLRNNPSNPEVDMQVIYDIYMKSIA